MRLRDRVLRRTLPFAATAAACFAIFPARASAPVRPLKYRWLYLAMNLQVNKNVPKVEALLRRAAAAGYNGVVLADFKLNVLDRVPDWYFKNAARVKQAADNLKIEIIPCVFPIGYSDGVLAHDPNLVEGMPVKGAVFTVKGGKADLEPDTTAGVRNGGFEESRGDTALGWAWQDEPGRLSFIDHNVKRSGSASLRFGVPGVSQKGAANWRASQKVTLKPWRCYRLTFWVKTQDLDSPGSFNAPLLIPNSKNPGLSHISFGVKRTQDWTLHQAVFNSQQFSEALLYLGIWGARSGALWLDDVSLEEIGLVNVVRREGCPLTVRGEDGTNYVEGRDFEPVEDPRMGNQPWVGSFELYHSPPSIVLKPGSRIRDGQRLRVSFYHPAFIYDMQTSCCLTHPKVYDVLRDQMQRVEKLFHPTAVMMSHDEARVANWCAMCQSSGKTPGQQLAENVKRCIGIVRETSPRARIYVWSDMFDPFHNARGDYYLVNGSWAGSWEGLSPEVGIVDWYFEARAKNLPFFAHRGHKQILAGYYDNNVDYTAQWLHDSQGVAGIEGVMYTTWANRYDDLEKYARAVWGGASGQ